MKDWYLALSERERLILSFGGGAALVLLAWALVWAPVMDDLGRLRQRVAAQEADLAWLQDAAVEARRLQAQAAAGPTRNRGTSLLTLVEQTTRAAGINEQVNRVDPQGPGRVQVRLSGVPFDDVVRWLGRLRTQHGIRVDSLVADADDDVPGLVGARVIMEREG